MSKAKQSKKQKPVNAVPLSSEVEANAETFLESVYDDNEGRSGIALLIIFRNDAGNGTVDANVLSTGLTDEYRDKMANAALKAISGKPLFYSF